MKQNLSAIVAWYCYLIRKQFMLPFFSGIRERGVETKERMLTIPMVILLLLIFTFFGSGIYILVSAFFS